MQRLRHVAPILLIACFLGLGSGLLRFAHDAAHAREDARPHAGSQGHDPAPPQHDESNCELHALLNAPLAAAPVVAVLICLGLFAAFLTLLSPAPDGLRLPARIDCRGPPPRHD